MPRPKSDLKRTMLVLSPADLKTLDDVARAEGLVTEAGHSTGEPNRSAAARHLIAEARKRIERAAKKSEKSGGFVVDST